MPELRCVWCGLSLETAARYPVELRYPVQYKAVCSCGIAYSETLLEEANPTRWENVRARKGYEVVRDGDSLIIYQHGAC